MQRRRVVVEDGLSNVKSALEAKGYEVLGMNQVGLNPDAVIISGQDDNIMGMQDIMVNAPVITASGMSADQIVNELDRRMNKIK